MSTTISTRESIHRPRRALLSFAAVAVLALGIGAAGARLASSDGAAAREPKPVATLATNVDIDALWNQLSAMPLTERDIVVAGLSPAVRARLASTAEEIATAAEHH